jgi:hypothetical protein
MARSDRYISPGKSEAAALARQYASLSKSLFESVNADDRVNSRIYNLAAESWREMHAGDGPALAVESLRTAAREDGLDPALTEAVIEEMERVLLRGYRDTLMAAPATTQSLQEESDPGPPPATPMTLATIYRLRAEMGEPMAAQGQAQADPDAADRERADRESVVISQMAQGFAPPRNQRRSRQ